ncbi:hypothetical protein B0H13DRAFT_1923279 [Mycena leptocephala]|nr:hypothetical protein B0H13DRAFT_1923279 [Mycena leptocephala]
MHPTQWCPVSFRTHRFSAKDLKLIGVVRPTPALESEYIALAFWSPRGVGSPDTIGSLDCSRRKVHVGLSEDEASHNSGETEEMRGVQKTSELAPRGWLSGLFQGDCLGERRKICQVHSNSDVNRSHGDGVILTRYYLGTWKGCDLPAGSYYRTASSGKLRLLQRPIICIFGFHTDADVNRTAPFLFLNGAGQQPSAGGLIEHQLRVVLSLKRKQGWQGDEEYHM